MLCGVWRVVRRVSGLWCVESGVWCVSVWRGLSRVWCVGCPVCGARCRVRLVCGVGLCPVSGAGCLVCDMVWRVQIQTKGGGE